VAETVIWIFFWYHINHSSLYKNRGIQNYSSSVESNDAITFDFYYRSVQ